MISLAPLIRRTLPKPLHTAAVLAAVAGIPHLPAVHGAVEAVSGSGGGSGDNVWIAVVASITAMASPFAAAAAKRLFGRPPKRPDERPKEVEHVTVPAEEYFELRAKAAELEQLKNGRRR